MRQELRVGSERLLRTQRAASVRWIDTAVYWVLLLLAIVANFVVSVVLVPILLVLEGFGLFLILFFIGISFGWLFGYVLHSLEVHGKQHVIWSIFIPVLAIINVAIFTMLSNKLIGLLKLSTPVHDPLLIGVFYVAGFILPGAVQHVMKSQ